MDDAAQPPSRARPEPSSAPGPLPPLPRVRRQTQNGAPWPAALPPPPRQPGAHHPLPQHHHHQQQHHQHHQQQQHAPHHDTRHPLFTSGPLRSLAAPVPPPQPQRARALAGMPAPPDVRRKHACGCGPFPALPIGRIHSSVPVPAFSSEPARQHMWVSTATSSTRAPVRPSKRPPARISESPPSSSPSPHESDRAFVEGQLEGLNLSQHSSNHDDGTTAAATLSSSSSSSRASMPLQQRHQTLIETSPQGQLTRDQTATPRSHTEDRANYTEDRATSSRGADTEAFSPPDSDDSEPEAGTEAANLVERPRRDSRAKSKSRPPALPRPKSSRAAARLASRKAGQQARLETQAALQQGRVKSRTTSDYEQVAPGSELPAVNQSLRRSQLSAKSRRKPKKSRSETWSHSVDMLNSSDSELTPESDDYETSLSPVPPPSSAHLPLRKPSDTDSSNSPSCHPDPDHRQHNWSHSSHACHPPPAQVVSETPPPQRKEPSAPFHRAQKQVLPHVIASAESSLGRRDGRQLGVDGGQRSVSPVPLGEETDLSSIPDEFCSQSEEAQTSTKLPLVNQVLSLHVAPDVGKRSGRFSNLATLPQGTDDPSSACLPSCSRRTSAAAEETGRNRTPTMSGSPIARCTPPAIAIRNSPNVPEAAPSLSVPDVADADNTLSKPSNPSGSTPSASVISDQKKSCVLTKPATTQQQPSSFADDDTEHHNQTTLQTTEFLADNSRLEQTMASPFSAAVERSQYAATPPERGDEASRSHEDDAMQEAPPFFVRHARAARAVQSVVLVLSEAVMPLLSPLTQGEMFEADRICGFASSHVKRCPATVAHSAKQKAARRQVRNRVNVALGQESGDSSEDDQDLIAGASKGSDPASLPWLPHSCPEYIPPSFPSPKLSEIVPKDFPTHWNELAPWPQSDVPQHNFWWTEYEPCKFYIWIVARTIADSHPSYHALISQSFEKSGESYSCAIRFQT